TVGVDLVQANNGVVEKIRELHLALSQARFEQLASLQLPLQALHAPFQSRRPLRSLRRVAGWPRFLPIERCLTMHGADSAEELAIAIAQLRDVVAAEQGECLRASEIVPQAFEPQRRARCAVAPEQPDHLTERTHRAPARMRLVDQAADLDAEQVWLRPAVREDLLQQSAGLERDVLPALLDCGYVDAACRQLPIQIIEVLTRRNDDAGAIGAQRPADEAFQGLDERLRIFVKLDQVLAVAELRPGIDGWRICSH